MINRIKHKLVNFSNDIFNKPIGIIYMLHRVDDFESDKLAPNENMKISPQFLEDFILKNKDEKNFISLDDAISVIKGIKKNSDKPFIVITLDDGYKDNYINAFPIFIKYNIPFTIFIATDFPDNKAFLWWYIIEEIILKHNNVILSTGESFDCSTIENKINAFMRIRAIVLELPYHNFEFSFKNLFTHYHVDSSEYNEMLISWEELKKMSNNPLCTIGAHSVSHYRMSLLNNTDIINEICESKRRIENITGHKVNHFAYPFGTSNELNSNVIELTKNSGLLSAVIAGGGEIRRFGTNPFALKRIMLTERT